MKTELSFNHPVEGIFLTQLNTLFTFPTSRNSPPGTSAATKLFTDNRNYSNLQDFISTDIRTFRQDFSFIALKITFLQQKHSC